MSAAPVGQGYTEPNAAYYLDQVRRYIAQNKAGKTSSNAYTPSYGVPVSDSATVTDAVATSSTAIGIFDVLDDSVLQQLWLSFDSDVIDKSGNTNDGTISGTETYVTDPLRQFDSRYAKGFSFNGTTQIDIANEVDFDRTNTQAFSISFWAKWTTASIMMLVTKMTATLNIGIEIGATATGAVRIRLRAAASEIDIITPLTYKTGTWQHFVFTKSTASNAAGCKLYIDGTSITMTVTTDTLAATIANNIAVTVGAYNGTTSRFTGSMDDVQWWNVELTAAEVTKLAKGLQISNNSAVLQPTFLNFADWGA